jgi:hypothetical protein
VSVPDRFSFLKKNRYYQLCPSAGKRAYIVLPTNIVEFVLHSKAKENKIKKETSFMCPFGSSVQIKQLESVL